MQHHAYTSLAAALLLIGCGSDQKEPASYPEDESHGAFADDTEEGHDVFADDDEARDPTGAEDADMRAAAGRLEPRTISTELKTSDATQLDGQAEFEQRENGVYVTVTVQNARAGTYAVHVHEKADCSDIPGKSMGGHFNPAGSEHGLPYDAEHHLGDLGNMTVAETGIGSLEVLVPNATLDQNGENSFMGRALVIHSGRDDGEGEAGHAGKPMACGTIPGQ